MSLILDALNRAEQNRQQEQHAPSLQSIHGEAKSETRSLRQRLHLERWLILLVVAYLVFDYFSSRDTTSAAPEAAPVQALPVDKPVEITTPQAMPAQAKQQAPPPAAAIEDRLESPDSVKSLYKSPPPERTVEAPAPVPAPNETAVEAAIDEPPVRLGRTEILWPASEEITDLAIDFRRQIPTLKYNDHSWTAQGDDNYVVLNGEVYRQGDTPAPGLLLKEIGAQGIVLEFQGTRFRLQAYNSWINFP